MCINTQISQISQANTYISPQHVSFPSRGIQPHEAFDFQHCHQSKYYSLVQVITQKLQCSPTPSLYLNLIHSIVCPLI